jgi:hypothetical protein
VCCLKKSSHVHVLLKVLCDCVSKANLVTGSFVLVPEPLQLSLTWPWAKAQLHTLSLCEAGLSPASSCALAHQYGNAPWACGLALKEVADWTLVF